MNSPPPPPRKNKDNKEIIPDLRVVMIIWVFPCAQAVRNISPFDKVHFFGLLGNPTVYRDTYKYLLARINNHWTSNFVNLNFLASHNNYTDGLDHSKSI